MFNNKRGQVTIFIIIAVLIVSAAGIYFLARGNISTDQINANTEDVYNFVVECIESKAEQAVYFIGQNGGYYIPEEPLTEEGVTIYSVGNEVLAPSKLKMEEELASYVNEGLRECVNNFENFVDREVSEGRIETTATLLKDSVNFDVNYPLTITKGSSTSRIQNFEDIGIPVRLEVVYDFSRTIVEQSVQNNGEICITCINELQKQNDIQVFAKNSDSQTVVYTLIDSKSYIKDNSIFNDTDYEFKFGVRA